jgi:hydroxymethylglutaryl-CoA synthase
MKMVGIQSFGAYVPFYRLSRSEIAQAWGEKSGRGEKAVANHDEDSITMAVAAGMNCLNGVNPQSIDGLYFASTTFPYKEKQSAALLAVALDLRSDIFTADFSGSLRAGTSAIRSAVDAIKAGSAKKVMVIVSDLRKGYPNGTHEKDFGDGSASFILSSDSALAVVEGSYNITNEISDVWRSDKDTFVQSWEDRFVREKGYLKVLSETVSGILQKYNMDAKDFAKVVFYTPNQKLLSTAARKLGFDPKIQVQDSLYDVVGNTGAALAPMLLCAALENAEAEDRILFAGYGDGSEAFILKVTEQIREFKPNRNVQIQLSTKKMINYQKYLRWREIIPVQPPSRPPTERPSAVALWRDSKGGLGLYGVKCQNCGTIQYPTQRVCIKCHEKDQFEPYRFADKKGKLTTFSHDNLAATTDPPVTVAVVDFDEGGRIMCDMTDKDPEEVRVGMPVEMTFRKVRYAGSIYDYWWKCVPVRV